MRAPLSWLRDHVHVDASPHEIARRLSISTLEVDRVIDVGVPDVGGNLGHFVVGRVLEAAKHPNADKLQLCQVDVGNPDPQQIVCGAWNFGAGATVAVGLPGALLPGFPAPLDERQLRGECLARDDPRRGRDRPRHRPLGDHAPARRARAGDAARATCCRSSTTSST